MLKCDDAKLLGKVAESGAVSGSPTTPENIGVTASSRKRYDKREALRKTRRVIDALRFVEDQFAVLRDALDELSQDESVLRRVSKEEEEEACCKDLFWAIECCVTQSTGFFAACEGHQIRLKACLERMQTSKDGDLAAFGQAMRQASVPLHTDLTPTLNWFRTSLTNLLNHIDEEVLLNPSSALYFGVPDVIRWRARIAGVLALVTNVELLVARLAPARSEMWSRIYQRVIRIPQ